MTSLYCLKYKVPLVNFGIIANLAAKPSGYFPVNNKMFVGDFLITCYWPWWNVREMRKIWHLFYSKDRERNPYHSCLCIPKWQISSYNSCKHSSVAKTRRQKILTVLDSSGPKPDSFFFLFLPLPIIWNSII